MFGLHNLKGEYSIWISPSAAGSQLSGSLSVFSGVSSAPTRDAEGPEGFGSGVEAEEFGGVGGRGSGNVTTVDVKTLMAWGLFSLTVTVSVSSFRLNAFYSVFVLVNIKRLCLFFGKMVYSIIHLQPGRQD